MLAAGTARADPSSDRWAEFASFCAASDRAVIIDAGTGEPPPALFAICERQWLITRACYLAITRANTFSLRPNGVVLVDEPGRSLRRGDIETSLGAPVVTRISCDPAIARSADSGLLGARLPNSMTRPIRRAA